MSDSYWRNRSAPIIARVLEATKGQSEKEISAALLDAYPFGPRKYHPYSMWRKEIKAQRGGKRYVFIADQDMRQAWFKLTSERSRSDS